MQGVSGFSGSDSGLLQLAHFFSGTEADDDDASAVVPEQLLDGVSYFAASLSSRANSRLSSSYSSYLLADGGFCVSAILYDRQTP